MAIVFYVVVVIRNSWIGDDAYITHRTIENFLNGYGLTWNVTERVQVFTHPLWLITLTVFYYFIRNIYFVSIGLSLVLSLSTICWFALKIAKSYGIAVFGILAMTVSSAYVDYSTSGLENPLTHFILILFIYFYFEKEWSAKTLFYISLLASLAATCRMDTILFYIPALIYVFWQIRSLKAVINIVFGFIPFIVWELFSLFYYGSFVPNTAYAKLNLGLDSKLLFSQGFIYLQNTLEYDLITASIIVFAVIFSFFVLKRKSAVIAIGILLTLLYVTKIGGCFMSGRLFSACFLGSVILLAYHFNKYPKYILYISIAIVLAVGLSGTYSPVYGGGETVKDHNRVYRLGQIIDERLWWYPVTGLLHFNKEVKFWPVVGWSQIHKKPIDSSLYVYVYGELGFRGYSSPPNVHILDWNGLADPLLSHLPINKARKYKPGHYRRSIPNGYVETIKSGINYIEDSNLAQYYSKLKVLTQGNLADLSRLATILKFNFGSYNHLLDEYIDHHIANTSISDINKPKPQGFSAQDYSNVIFDSSGVIVYLDSLTYATSFEIGRDNNDDLLALYWHNDEKIAEQEIPATIIPGGGLSTSTVIIPPKASSAGFDRIEFFPTKGDGFYSIGYLILNQ